MNGVTQAGIDAGNACLAKANAISPDWSERALSALRMWASGPVTDFTMDEARAGIAKAGTLDAPHDLRAWGPVTRLAVQLGIIKDTGLTAPAASSNGSRKPLYQSLV